MGKDPASFSLPEQKGQNSMERTLLFVYGTLQKGHPLHHVLAGYDARFIAKCRTLDSFIMRNNGYPFVMREPENVLSRSVVGELYSVPIEAFERLDIIESAYTREKVQVRDSDSNEIYETFMYIGRGNRSYLEVYPHVDDTFVWPGYTSPLWTEPGGPSGHDDDYGDEDDEEVGYDYSGDEYE